MTRPMILVLALVLTASCSKRGPAAPTTTPAGKPTSGARGNATAGADQALGASVGITAPCVLHAGESHVPAGATPGSNDEGKAAKDIQCSADAQCVQKAGAASGGDGVVALACVGRKCRCMLRRLAPPMKRAQQDFQLDAPCSGSDAQRLLVDRCMTGLTTVQ